MIDRAAVDAPCRHAAAGSAGRDRRRRANRVDRRELARHARVLRSAAEITKWLIEEKGFYAVAAEADWPDAYRVNRYVRGLGDDGSADEALSGFERFPAWMWRNDVVRDFVDWLHAHNQRRREHGDRQTGFYGLDLYSLHRSMQEVIAYLDNVDPARPRGPASATPASTTLRPTTARRTVSPQPSAPVCHASARRSSS